MSAKVLSFLLLSFSFSLTAQVDFNNYTSLQAHGKLLNFIKNDVKTMVALDLKERKAIFIDDKTAENFLNDAYQRLEEKLYDGSCVFGDDVSRYVEAVNNKIFSGNKHHLIRHIEYITVKSNDAFLFSSYPGIIFVSTGFMAQLSNEAQLAYWLSVAVAHLELKVDQAIYLNDVKRKVSDFNYLGKVPLEEAYKSDSLGLIYYYEAGFNKDDITDAFLLKLYDYLPFEEQQLNESYFNNDLYYIPVNSFPQKMYPATYISNLRGTENKDLVKRKNNIELKALHLTNWGDSTFIHSEEQFLNVRKICRFESVRNSVIDQNLVQSLYTIYLLERNEPTPSIYLQRLKALTWHNIAVKRISGNIRYRNFSESTCEGELCNLFSFLRASSKVEVLTLALRTVTDIKNALPEDEMIRGIYDKLLIHLAGYKDFTLDLYYNKTFPQAIREAQEKENADTTNQLVDFDKYDKIATKRHKQAIDSTLYFEYGLSDLMKDEMFKRHFNHLRDSINDANPYNKDLTNLTPEERYKYMRELEKQKREAARASFGVRRILIVKPTVNYYFNSDISNEKREKNDEELAEDLNKNAAKANVSTEMLTKQTIRSVGLTEFNKLNIYQSYRTQIINYSFMNPIPVDYFLIKPFAEKEETRYILFVDLRQNYTNSLTIKAELFDSVDGIKINEDVNRMAGKPSKTVYNAFFYHYFKQF